MTEHNYWRNHFPNNLHLTREEKYSGVQNFLDIGNLVPYIPYFSFPFVDANYNGMVMQLLENKLAQSRHNQWQIIASL